MNLVLYYVNYRLIYVLKWHVVTGNANSKRWLVI